MTLHEMLAGATAPAFWIEVVCLLVAFAMLASRKRRANMRIVGCASALVVLSVLCKRIWLLFTSFIHPNIAYGPGISSGSLSARQSAGDAIWATASTYMPTIPEIFVALAVVSFGGFLFIVLTHVLVPKWREAHPAAAASLDEEVAAEA